MEILIKKDAAKCYLRRFTGEQIPNMNWAKVLKSIEGTKLTVDTQFLFRDQFNTIALADLPCWPNGLRIMEEDVEEVFDDIRIGMYKCSWCGTQTRDTICPKCNNDDHLSPLCSETKNKIKDNSLFSERGYDIYGKKVSDETAST